MAATHAAPPARPPHASALGTALFNEPIVSKGSGGLVLVRDIDFASTSVETLLPFHGRCHIAYVPAAGVVLGLSKLARLTKLAARRVQSQESLTRRLLGALRAELRPLGAAVVVDARHLSYAEAAPQRRLTAGADGCLAAGGGAAGAGLLEEALAMLGLDAGADGLRLLGAAEPPPPEGGARGASDAGEGDSPMAPVTPDPSERDDASSSAGSARCMFEGGDAGSDASSSCGADGDAADGMEAAVAGLLAEAGVRDAASPAVRAGVRRYVLSLLAATAGYHTELPLGRPRPQQGACRRHSPDKQQQQRHGQQQQQHGQQQGQQQLAVRPAWSEHHVPFVSQCEHHMLPFYGSVHIAYLPARYCAPHSDGDGGGAGSCVCSGCSSGGACDAGGVLSAEAAQQVVAAFTQRLQVQERITQQVADAVAALTGAAGVLVVVRAAHMCMVARGVENHAGTTLTRAATGEFEARPQLRAEFLRAVAARGEEGACGSGRRACGC